LQKGAIEPHDCDQLTYYCRSKQVGGVAEQIAREELWTRPGKCCVLVHRIAADYIQAVRAENPFLRVQDKVAQGKAAQPQGPGQ
jgi:hypothetical protein